MRTHLTLVALTAALALTGCKKKAEPQAPAEAPAEAPAKAAVTGPEISWTSAAYAGGHMSDSVGTITYKVTVTNPNAEQALTLSMISVGAKGENGRVCVAKHDEAVTVRPSSSADLEVSGDCMYSKLPEQGDVKLMGVMMVDSGKGATETPIGGAIAISR